MIAKCLARFTFLALIILIITYLVPSEIQITKLFIMFATHARGTWRLLSPAWLIKMTHLTPINRADGRTSLEKNISFNRNVLLVIKFRCPVCIQLISFCFSMAVFWDVAPCSLIEVYRRFRRAYCLQPFPNISQVR
jgi:hypothetical protein